MDEISPCYFLVLFVLVLGGKKAVECKEMIQKKEKRRADMSGTDLEVAVL